MVDGVYFMHKKFTLWAILLIVSFGVSVTAYGRYIRKQLQPDFFMPKEVQFNQPEKLPPLSKEELFNAKLENMVATVDKSEFIGKKTEITVPDYQKKFDDYNRDISYINRSGEIPVNSSLKADLDQMNSNELFEAQEKELGPETQVSRAFMRILDKSIAEN